MKFVLMLLSLLTIVACSKKETYTVETVNGVKVYRNTNIPADPNFKIEPKELFTIDKADDSTTFKFIRGVDIDSKNNIYIIDKLHCTISKYDSNGVFITKFGGKGYGPGEIADLREISLCNDTIFVTDLEQQKISKFSIDGKYISSFQASPPLALKVFNGFGFAGVLRPYSNIDGKNYWSYSLNIVSNKFEPILELNNLKANADDKNFDFNDYMSPFVVGDKQIFVADISSTDYRIKVYDSKGTNTYTIRKSYASVPFNEYELSEYHKTLNKTTYTGDEKQSNVKYKKFVAFKGMHYGKNGYLYVQSAQKRTEKNQFDCVVDAFKDGVYINSFTMKLGKSIDYIWGEHYYTMINDRIYYINREDNYVKVFKF